MTGGIIDLRCLFKNLATCVNSPLNDDWIEDHVSLADKTQFEHLEHDDNDNK